MLSSVQVFALALLFLSSPSAWSQAPAVDLAETYGKRPANVLLIIADQWNARCVGYGAGGFGGLTQPLTPRLDELAQEGTAFTRAYSDCPQCKPARWTIMTGKEARVHGVRWNDVWDPPWQETVADVFRNAGYRTALIGKHHYPWLQQPDGYGFDHGFDEVTDLQDYHSSMAFAGIPHWYAPGHHWAMPNLPPRLAFTGYTTNPDEHHPVGYWAARSIDFLEQRAEDLAPFFLVHSFFGPHTPFLPSAPATGDNYANLHQPASALDLPPNHGLTGNSPRMEAFQQQFGGMNDADHREILSYYYGLISQIDASIGRVLDALEENGLARNTLVIFTADHGAYGSEFGSWTKGGGGQEALVHIPMIVRLPLDGGVGRVSEELVSHLDLVPTLLEVTGVPAPEEWRMDRSGSSLVPLVDQAGAPHAWRDEVVVDFGSAHHAPMQVVVTADHKLIVDSMGMDENLIDLVNDPFELVDLAGDPTMAAVDADLHQRLSSWEQGLVTAPPYLGTGAESAQAAPAHITLPIPVDHGQLPPGPAILRWVPSTSAVIQRLWLSRAGEPFELRGILSPHRNEWHMGPTVPGSHWQWRVDTYNAHGLTMGTRLHFTAHQQGHLYAGSALYPRPSDRVRVDALDLVLRWTPSEFSSSQRVWLGKSPETLALVADRLPGDMSSLASLPIPRGERFFWRVDSLIGPRLEEGILWRFDTTNSGLLEPPQAPSPMHLGRVRAGSIELKAKPVPGAVQYHFFAGTDLPLTPMGSAPSPTLTLPAVQAGERWSWRIDVEGPNGVRQGFTWTFCVL